MKILHINTFSRGGAFTGAYRLHLALMKNGISSKMLVREKPDSFDLQEVYVYNEPERSVNILNQVSNRLGFPLTYNQKKWNYTKGLKGKYEIISFPFSDYDITKSKEYREADIINLHWVAEYLDYRSFFKKCDKPIVITLRDLNPILGIFHYEGDKDLNIEFSHLEERYSNLKKRSLSHHKGLIKVVGISDWISNKSLESSIHINFGHSTIHNCIDFNNYELIDKKIARKNLNINSEAIVFSFVSQNASNNRKGLDLLLQAISALPETNKLVILTVGQGCELKFPLNVTVRHLGVCSTEELNKIYCASDAFLFPTKEEALGNVMLEAMACGTPVIGTPVGGLLDVIKPGFNGIFSKDLTSEGLKEVISEFIKIKDQFDHQAIRKYIEENFNEELIAGKYIELYKSLLQKN